MDKPTKETIVYDRRADLIVMKAIAQLEAEVKERQIRIEKLKGCISQA